MSDDYDTQFRDIVSSQLADLDVDDLAELDPLPDAPEPPPVVVAPPAPSPRSWTPAEEVDDFVPPPPLPAPARPSVVAWVAIAAVVVGVALVLGAVTGLLSQSWAGVVGLVAMGAGILLLFTRLPRHRSPGDDNGARL